MSEEIVRLCTTDPETAIQTIIALEQENKSLKAELKEMTEFRNDWEKKSHFQEKQMNKAMIERENAHDHLQKLQATNGDLTDKVDKLKKVAPYAAHERDCIIMRWEAGEPTTDGGYRSQYAGKWYQVRPVDETPRCTCGFDEAWDTAMNAEQIEKLEPPK